MENYLITGGMGFIGSNFIRTGGTKDRRCYVKHRLWGIPKKNLLRIRITKIIPFKRK